MHLNETDAADDRTLYVDRSTAERGSKAPFFVAYAGPSGDDRLGYLCDNCGRMDNAMGTMGRIECNVCGNIRKPEEWDAAHE